MVPTKGGVNAHSAQPVTVLLADDDPDDQVLTCDAFKEARLTNEVRCVTNGEELLQYLRHEGRFVDTTTAPRPGLILLDLNMPKIDGREALSTIKSDPNLRCIPVIIMTTSRAEQDILKSYDLGANSYVTKPATFAELVEVVRGFGHYWFELVHLPYIPKDQMN
ncbi:MAG: response regulator [Trueperaceae bacterium]